MEEKVTVSVGGETWDITPLKGLRAIQIMPDVIGMCAEIVYAAYKGGIRIDEWFSEDFDGEIRLQLDTILRAIGFVSNVLGEKYDRFSREIVPFLLQKDYEFLENNGTMQEIGIALWRAVQFHIKTSFGEEVLTALKNFAGSGAQEEKKED